MTTAKVRVRRDSTQLDYAILRMLHESGIAASWRITCYLNCNKQSVRERLQALVLRGLIVEVENLLATTKDDDYYYYAATNLGVTYMNALEGLLTLLGIDTSKGPI